MTAETTAIRSFQLLKGDSKWLPFGRMTWNKKNNEKWADKYWSGEHIGQEPNFTSTEIWAPDWNAAAKKERAPDVFAMLERFDSSPIRQALTIAIREPIYSDNAAKIRDAVTRLGALLPDPVHYFGHQPWAESVWDSFYSNGLSDRGASTLVKQLVRSSA
ncbi:hypothetical protein [Lysobacter sp. CA199]|uniref:hypothetical protein n=1 Tax=Lysobacter sp. CA199 TaxID=3455608 RepID=UPI003F8D2188